MAEPVRLRLEFEDRHLLTKFQRSEGLKRCWVLLRPDLATIGDLANHLVVCFALQRSCPHGLVLSMDEFVLPSFESTCIFKDKDILRVKKKGGRQKHVIEIHDAYCTKDSDVVDKQPILSNDRLLAIKDSRDNSSGYKRKNEEEGCALEENAIHKQTTLSGDTNSKRKRKESDKPLSSKRKKIKLTSPEMPITTIAEDEHIQSEQNQRCSRKKDRKKSLDRAIKPSNEDGRSDTLVSSQDDVGARRRTSSVPTEDGHDPVEGNHQKNTCTYHADGSTEKSPSRSASRKKAKKQWHQKMKEMAIQQMEKDMRSQVPANDTNDASAKHRTVNEIAEKEDEIVPVIVRPGHIRFESSDAEQSKLLSNGPVETLQWNGTTSMKKGQKWGREKTVSKRNDDNACNWASNKKIVAEEGKHVDGHIDFGSLYPLTRLPKEADVLVYRLVELSSSWCPELSPFRVGKVSSYDSISMKIVLVPVPEYPLFSKQNNDTVEMAQQPDVSRYKEDGSLEIEYPSLVDVRLLKPNESGAENMSAPQGSRTTVAAPVNNWESALAKNTAIEPVTPCIGRRPNMGWERIEQASSEKNAELQQNNGWGSWTPNKKTGTTSWSNRAMSGSALGPTLAFLRGKEAKYASMVNGKHASSANGRYAGSYGRYANSNGRHFNSTTRKYNGPTKKW
ncbi:coilin isoform X1 [Elaeis guineensis]|uniref:Coilin isoform X1 n=1 Tax=Elaeis guineensis var. tenera TaxID=51953 RepID=A0A6I9RNL8_ELAGV|nr:coilin isoform X1 [Elaeis guineensis]